MALRTFLLGSVLGVFGCVPPGTGGGSKDGFSTGDENDGDAYSPSEGDCDDNNPDVNPGAPEKCNGIDDNCDGLIDEGVLQTFFIDADGDGFGTAETVEACESPDDGALVDGDCDDADRSVFPGAPEVCNRVDDDCDGAIDEDVGSIYYVDGDADGYGDPLTAQQACDGDAGLVENGEDCDDTDSHASPAADEACDGVDNDCDGSVDEGVGVTFYADLDGDGHGDAAAPLDACAEPVGYAAVGDDCDDGAADVFPGADEVCNGRDDDCDGAADEGAVDASAWYTDGDGDGYGAGAAVVSCEAPPGTVSTSGDCDDGDAGASPIAAEVCDGKDDDCDGSVDEDSAVDAATWYGDADGDGFGATTFVTVSCTAPAGYVSGATDCDDLDANVYPGAPETCDGLDEDCDGSVDEGAVDMTDFYADTDTDGYGDVTTGVTDCSAPAGFVADAADCDDTAANVHPGATETCDGVDEDCDGAIDDGVAILSWYADNDGDTFGDSTISASGCAAPSGYVALATDCDDTDPTIHPGATETCDRVDEDCDGAVDDGVAVSSWYADNDSDGYGDATSVVVTCSAPAGSVLDATDCDDADAAIHPGAAETCDGVDEDCDGTVDDGLTTSTWYVDADSDGYGDATTAVTDCTAPAGYVADGTDCDDTDALLFPEASGACADGFDCQDILDRGASTGSGSYSIDPDGSGAGNAPFAVLCQMDLYGGGWTQAIQAYLDTLSTSVSRNYLYSYGNNWYVSPSTTKVWSWSTYQAESGTYGYGTGSTLTSTFSCTSAESGHWGVGCSSGGGRTYKVLPIYASSATAATSTICQDRPDVFGVGACRTGASIWVRE